MKHLESKKIRNMEIFTSYAIDTQHKHIYIHTHLHIYFFSLLHWGNNHIFWKEKHYSFLASSFNLTAEWELKWSLDQVTYVPMHHISAGHQPQVNCTCTFSCLLPATPTGWTRSWVSSNCLILVFIYPVLLDCWKINQQITLKKNIWAQCTGEKQQPWKIKTYVINFPPWFNGENHKKPSWLNSLIWSQYKECHNSVIGFKL